MWSIDFGHLTFQRLPRGRRRQSCSWRLDLERQPGEPDGSPVGASLHGADDQPRWHGRLTDGRLEVMLMGRQRSSLPDVAFLRAAPGLARRIALLGMTRESIAERQVRVE